MIDIRIWGVPQGHLHWGMKCAEHFGMQYPDRLGMRRGCAYRHEWSGASVYVYRTKGGQIVVRGEGEEQ